MRSGFKGLSAEVGWGITVLELGGSREMCQGEPGQGKFWKRPVEQSISGTHEPSLARPETRRATWAG